MEPKITISVTKLEEYRNQAKTYRVRMIVWGLVFVFSMLGIVGIAVYRIAFMGPLHIKTIEDAIIFAIVSLAYIPALYFLGFLPFRKIDQNMKLREIYCHKATKYAHLMNLKAEVDKSEDENLKKEYMSKIFASLLEMAEEDPTTTLTDVKYIQKTQNAKVVPLVNAKDKVKEN